MNTIIQLIIVCSILIQYQADCGNAKCSYKFSVARDYICTITLTPSDDEIDNKTIPETYNEISGEHNGGSDDLVTALGGSGTNSRIFPGSLCRKFRNLKKIIFAYSTIQKLTEKSFESCEKLETLSFVDTDIKWIGQDALKNLGRLEKLTIGSSKLSYVSENLLKNNRNLKELKLSSNQISLFNEKLLENQGNLQKLFLPYNKLEGFSKYFFRSLRNLETLDLQNNLIVQISAIWFETLTNLKELDLSSNLIEDLPKNVFIRQTKLGKLNLDSNSIKYMHDDLFLVLPNVIRLMKNEIIGLNENFIKALVNTKKSVLLARNKCTEDSQILFEREGVPDEQISSPDEIYLQEIEPCFYSYIPRNENYKDDNEEKLNFLSEKIQLFLQLFRL